MNITFHPEEKTIEAFPEQTILEVARQGDVDLVATCGGKGLCNSCRVQIIQGEFTPPTQEEIDVLGATGLGYGFRLACQARALSDGIVRLWPPIAEYSFRILSRTERQQYSLEPDVEKLHFVLPHLTEEQQSSDFEEIRKILAPSISLMPGDDNRISHIDLPVLQSLPLTLYRNFRDVTVVKWNRSLISIEPGDTTDYVYGLAFDVGTTTVVGYLLDLLTGREIAVASELNAQAVYGGDLMSRISFAQQGSMAQEKLHERIIRTLNKIIDDICDQAEIDSQQIYELTIVGNSCMHHLLLNISPVHLGFAPYLAAIRERYVVTAADLKLNVLPQARVVMLPLIAGFVGADTVGVILATGLHTSQQLKLAIDIGTNGELVLGSEKRLIACSTAAGTAFEGAQITHGIRGSAGAIDRVFIDSDVHCHVIGERLAQGVCGSGLVDAIAQLLEAGIIDHKGRLLTPEEIEQNGHPLSRLLKERIVHEKGQRHFILLYGNQTENGGPIVITQQDIRELQLAKGAIAAGIKTLMRTLGIQKDDIAEILLAGAFGNYIDTESALRIGLIPNIPLEKVRSVGNAAGLGSQFALLSGKAKHEADVIAKHTEHIALTNNPEFQTIFAEEMRFPEKRC